MCAPQGESGTEPILAAEELRAMYQRILERQIAPPDAAGEDAPAGGGGERLQQRRLAATLGLTLRYTCRCICIEVWWLVLNIVAN